MSTQFTIIFVLNNKKYHAEVSYFDSSWQHPCGTSYDGRTVNVIGINGQESLAFFMANKSDWMQVAETARKQAFELIFN